MPGRCLLRDPGVGLGDRDADQPAIAYDRKSPAEPVVHHPRAARPAAGERPHRGKGRALGTTEHPPQRITNVAIAKKSEREPAQLRRSTANFTGHPQDWRWAERTMVLVLGRQTPAQPLVRGAQRGHAEAPAEPVRTSRRDGRRAGQDVRAHPAAAGPSRSATGAERRSESRPP